MQYQKTVRDITGAAAAARAQEAARSGWRGVSDWLAYKGRPPARPATPPKAPAAAPKEPPAPAPGAPKPPAKEADEGEK